MFGDGHFFQLRNKHKSDISVDGVSNAECFELFASEWRTHVRKKLKIFFDRKISISKRREMDFGELKNDKDFVAKATNLQNALNKIEERISAVCDFPNYDDLSTEEKVKYDLFLSYSINSLYWMLCKLQAIEPGMVSATNWPRISVPYVSHDSKFPSC